MKNINWGFLITKKHGNVVCSISLDNYIKHKARISEKWTPSPYLLTYSGHSFVFKNLHYPTWVGQVAFRSFLVHSAPFCVHPWWEKVEHFMRTRSKNTKFFDKNLRCKWVLASSSVLLLIFVVWAFGVVSHELECWPELLLLAWSAFCGKMRNFVCVMDITYLLENIIWNIFCFCFKFILNFFTLEVPYFKHQKVEDFKLIIPVPYPFICYTDWGCLMTQNFPSTIFTLLSL